MKNRALKATVCALSVAAASVLSTSSAFAADDAPDVTETDVIATLPTDELTKWNELSAEEKEQSLAILDDPAFLTSDFNLQDNPEVEVGYEETVSGGIEARAASKTRSITQNWKILGVTYAEVSTRIKFVGTAAKGVISIENCWTNVVNRVPLRVINWSNYDGKTGANAPSAWCKADLSIARVGQATQYGTQGLLVNGGGTITTRWKL